MNCFKIECRETFLQSRTQLSTIYKVIWHLILVSEEEIGRRRQEVQNRVYVAKSGNLGLMIVASACWARLQEIIPAEWVPAPLLGWFSPPCVQPVRRAR